MITLPIVLMLEEKKSSGFQDVIAKWCDKNLPL